MRARGFWNCGFPAIATTSAGIAYALGYPYGERLTRATRCLIGRMGQELRERGTYASIPEGESPYPEANRLFSVE